MTLLRKISRWFVLTTLMLGIVTFAMPASASVCESKARAKAVSVGGVVVSFRDKGSKCSVRILIKQADGAPVPKPNVKPAPPPEVTEATEAPEELQDEPS